MSWSSGLSPCPSGGATGSRLNGFDEKIRKAKKPRLSAACAARVATSVSSRSRRSKIAIRSEEHTSELQSLMRTPYSVLYLKKKKSHDHRSNTYTTSLQSH